MTISFTPNEAIEQAVATGKLSAIDGEPEYIGDFMYTGDDISGTHHRFKHIIARYYVDVPKEAKARFFQ